MFCLFVSPLLRATRVRPAAAGEEAEVVARPVEMELGTRTTRSPPSLHPTTPSLLFFTWWSTTLQATSATRCHTMGSSTRTPTRNCPRSWCLTCWHRTATWSPAKCPRWVAQRGPNHSNQTLHVPEKARTLTCTLTQVSQYFQHFWIHLKHIKQPF